MKDHFFLAFRNLRRRGLRSWLTLIGILIGIMTVVSLISLGNGLRLAVLSQFGISSTEIITIQAGGVSSFGPPGQGAANPLTIKDAEAIEKLGPVQYAIPRNIETTRIEFNNKQIIGITVSMPEGRKRAFVYDVLSLDLQDGRLLKSTERGEILLGNNYFVKDKSGFDKAVRVNDILKIDSKNFKVAGIFKKKGSFIFDSMILMDEKDLDDLVNFGDKTDIIAVKVTKKEEMEQAKIDIEKLLRQRRNVKEGEEDFQVSTPQAALDTVNSVLTGIQIFIVLIALVSIIVGAIGIVNTMTTSVLERKKEIGIMKAIGAKNSDIFFQFFIEAGLLGLIGGAIGALFGIAIGYFGTLAISNFLGSSITPAISLPLIFYSLLGSFVIGSISGITPAMRAARQKPVEALRS